MNREFKNEEFNKFMNSYETLSSFLCIFIFHVFLLILKIVWIVRETSIRCAHSRNKPSSFHSIFPRKITRRNFRKIPVGEYEISLEVRKKL